ncbi:hypothetical protein N9A67_06130 [Rhodobacteraceae bacterium]|nr:hypothetical protein [Paracoccaceae bacterium]
MTLARQNNIGLPKERTPNDLISSPTVMRSRIRFILSGLLFKIALDVSYATFLTDAFANHFLTPFPVNFDVLRYLESSLWLLLVLVFLPFSSKLAGGLAFFCAVVFFYAPITTIYGMDLDRSRDTVLLSTLAIVAAHLVDIVGFRRRIKTTLPKHGDTALLILSFTFVLSFLGISAFTGVLFSMNFDIARVYEFRTEFGSQVDVGIFAYTNLWTQKVFTPIILAVGLRRGSIWLICFALAMHFVYFGVTQHRSHLFAPILVFIAYLLYRREFSYAKGYALMAVALFMITQIVITYDLEVIGALVIRRALFVGASVTYNWVEYFTEHPNVFFADNLLKSYIVNQYTGVNLPKLLGDFMRQDMELAFNSGLVGSGFAQLGAFGVILYGGIIGAIIRFNRRLIDAGVPPYIPAAILFFPYRIAWADADLFTALLSHGLIVGTFAVWLFGSSRNHAA